MSTNLPPTGKLTVVFDEEERSEVLQLLEAALGETRVEFRHTQTADYRAKVKQREELLKRLIERLRNVGA